MNDSDVRILIVDDEKNIRMTLERALESSGYRVDAAASGEEALRKLDTEGANLMLLDLKMPGLDGMQVLHRVRERKIRLKVIIITAHGTVDNAVEAMKLGAVDFLQKPFGPAEIRDAVDRALQRQALLDAHRSAAGGAGGPALDATGYDTLIDLAKACIEEQDFDSAADQARLAIGADPARAEALNLLGALVEIGQNFLLAQKYYRMALILDPAYRPAETNLRRLTRDAPEIPMAFDDAGGERQKCT
jgi:DNA-binding response OmpR family regulator